MKLLNAEDKFDYELWKTTGIIPFNPAAHTTEALKIMRGIFERIDNKGRPSIMDIIMYLGSDMEEKKTI